MEAISLPSRPRGPYNLRTVAVTRHLQKGSPMPPSDAVTHWIDRLKAGDREAVQPLWERYFQQMVRLARQRLRNAPSRVADEEDVALSAFDSFCRRAEEGHFPKLTDRDSLWGHLIKYTIRKASHQIRRERAQKRGVGKVRDEAWLGGEGEQELEQVLSREPDPELAALAVEQYLLLLDRLPDESLREVAQWKLEGYSNDEIALKLGCVRRSVERRLNLIRTLWQEEGES